MANTVVFGQKPVETDLEQDKSTGSDDLLVSWQELEHIFSWILLLEKDHPLRLTCLQQNILSVELMLDLPDSFWESQQYSIDDEIYPLRYGDYAEISFLCLWQFDIVSEKGCQPNWFEYSNSDYCTFQMCRSRVLMHLEPSPLPPRAMTCNMPTPAPLVNPALEHATALPLPEVTVTEYLRSITDATFSLVDDFEEQLNEVSFNSEDNSEWIDPMLGIDPIAEFESGLLDLFPPAGIPTCDDNICMDFLDGEVCTPTTTFKFCILHITVDGFAQKLQALLEVVHLNLLLPSQLAFQVMFPLGMVLLLLNPTVCDPEWDPGGSLCTPSLGAIGICTTTSHEQVLDTTAHTSCGCEIHLASGSSPSPVSMNGEHQCQQHPAETATTMIYQELFLLSTTVQLDEDPWCGSTHSFVLIWQNQVRLYLELIPDPPSGPTPPTHRFSGKLIRHQAFEPVSFPDRPFLLVKSTRKDNSDGEVQPLLFRLADGKWDPEWDVGGAMCNQAPDALQFCTSTTPGHIIDITARNLLWNYLAIFHPPSIYLLVPPHTEAWEYRCDLGCFVVCMYCDLHSSMSQHHLGSTRIESPKHKYNNILQPLTLALMIAVPFHPKGMSSIPLSFLCLEITLMSFQHSTNRSTSTWIHLWGAWI
jgi:hypothetical protein